MVDIRVSSERPYQALVTLCAGEKDLPCRIAFLDEGIVRVTVDPTGEFAPYARPVSPDHVARIQAQPDEFSVYAHPAADVTEKDGALVARAGATSVLVDATSGRMTFCLGGRVVAREAAPLRLEARSSTQTLELAPGERFFGGGTQNGRVDHAGSVVRIVTTPMNSNQWGDGGVASSSPFFWSSSGYGVLRSTFAPGAYDFGAAGDVVSSTHEDPVFDAYLFLAEPGDLRSTAQAILRAYYKVTGAPALLPEFAFYLGHLNAYNRDAWSREPEGDAQAWTVRGSVPANSPGVTRYELGRRRGYVVPEGHDAESLNGEDEVLRASAQRYRGRTPYEFSARAVIDEHARHDMPLGWILPNDGYGAGYGHNGYEMTGGVDADGRSSPERLAAIAANVDNLASFSAYANERGVEVGLWAQSQITPSPDPSVTWQNLRDFHAEVSRAGARPQDGRGVGGRRLLLWPQRHAPGLRGPGVPHGTSSLRPHAGRMGGHAALRRRLVRRPGRLRLGVRPHARAHLRGAGALGQPQRGLRPGRHLRRRRAGGHARLPAEGPHAHHAGHGRLGHAPQAAVCRRRPPHGHPPHVPQAQEPPHAVPSHLRRLGLVRGGLGGQRRPGPAHGALGPAGGRRRSLGGCREVRVSPR